MDNQSQQEFDRIVKILPENLTQPDIDFLYGRRVYLTKAQANDFADVIKAKDAEVADAATADANDKSEPTGKGAAAKPQEDQASNDTAKQTPEDSDLGTAREEAEQKADKVNK